MTDNKNSSPVSVLQNIFFKLYFKIFFFSSFCYFEKSFVFFGYNKTALFLIWPFRKHFIFSSLFFTVKEILTRSNKPDQTAACQRALQTNKQKKKNSLESKTLQTFFFFCWTIFPLQAMIDYTEVPNGTKVGKMCLFLRIFTHFEHFFCVSFRTSATTRAPWRRDCFKVILPSKQLLSRPSLSDDRLSAFQCNHLSHSSSREAAGHQHAQFKRLKSSGIKLHLACSHIWFWRK